MFGRENYSTNICMTLKELVIEAIAIDTVSQRKQVKRKKRSEGNICENTSFVRTQALKRLGKNKNSTKDTENKRLEIKLERI